MEQIWLVLWYQTWESLRDHNLHRFSLRNVNFGAKIWFVGGMSKFGPTFLGYLLTHTFKNTHCTKNPIAEANSSYSRGQKAPPSEICWILWLIPYNRGGPRGPTGTRFRAGNRPGPKMKKVSDHATTPHFPQPPIAPSLALLHPVSSSQCPCLLTSTAVGVAASLACILSFTCASSQRLLNLALCNSPGLSIEL